MFSRAGRSGGFENQTISERGRADPGGAARRRRIKRGSNPAYKCNCIFAEETGSNAALSSPAPFCDPCGVARRRPWFYLPDDSLKKKNPPHIRGAPCAPLISASCLSGRDPQINTAAHLARRLRLSPAHSCLPLTPACRPPPRTSARADGRRPLSLITPPAEKYRLTAAPLPHAKKQDAKRSFFPVIRAADIVARPNKNFDFSGKIRTKSIVGGR